MSWVHKIIKALVTLWAVMPLTLPAQHSTQITTLKIASSISVAPRILCPPPVARARTPAVPVADPMEIPSDDVVRESLYLYQPRQTASSPLLMGGQVKLRQHNDPSPLRIAFWGDSHLAAGFFTDELSALAIQPKDAVIRQILPVGLALGGKSMLIKDTCVSPQWRYESAHTRGAASSHPGPGLLNLQTQDAGAFLAWDFRKSDRPSPWNRITILFQQQVAPSRLAISVDGAPAILISPTGAPGPAGLELISDQPISTLRIEIEEGGFRFHGLSMDSTSSSSASQLDVFGYSGATVSGWVRSDVNYLGAWFKNASYNDVVLAFGTNEGNVKPFNAPLYAAQLLQAVNTLKRIFPGQRCILIAPGDRGVRLRRSQQSMQAILANNIDLMQYTRLHALIGQIQRDIAIDHGCLFWSMFDAMGGAGSAYQWAKQTPALMAPDLIHFTPAGYRHLARRFASDFGFAID